MMLNDQYHFPAHSLLSTQMMTLCLPGLCLVSVSLHQSGMRVVFELKKEVQSAAHYQAMVTLLLANFHAARYGTSSH
jgi:hypothetical protein